MVNTGKPSYGCQDCRKAHQKCDLGLPACSRCSKRERKCQYPDSLNITFRDETSAIQTKSDRRRRQANISAPRKTIALPSSPKPTLTSIVSPITYVGTTQEHFALTVCFSRSGGMHHDRDNPHGFIEFLPQLVAAAKPNSPLERATCALTLFACQHVLDRKVPSHSFFQLGRKVLGEALRMTNLAIQDPEARSSDDTLMAVMVMNIIDNLLCMIERRTPSEAHLLGASQLIRLRGKKNCKNVVSQRMLAGVQSESAGKALRQCIPVKGTSSGSCSDDWADGSMSQSPDLAAGPLNYLAERVASVQAFVRAFLECPPPDSQDSALLAAVLKVDQQLMNWECTIPKTWYPKQAVDLSTTNLNTFQAYGKTMDIYESVWVANTYNSFRMLRILLQVLAHDIVRSHPRIISVLPYGPLAYSSTAQRLIDEICASVPYFMGNRTPDIHPAAIVFPAAEDFMPSLAYRQFALRAGAWFLRAPLNMCATYELLHIRQRTWIESQIKRLDGFHNLRGSYQGLFPSWEIDLAGKRTLRSHLVQRSEVVGKLGPNLAY
jgi:hypothetical protein